MKKLTITPPIPVTNLRGQKVIDQNTQEQIIIKPADVFFTLTESPEFHGDLKGVLAIELSVRAGKWIREIPPEGGEVEIDDDLLEAFRRSLEVFSPGTQFAHCLLPIVECIKP